MHIELMNDYQRDGYLFPLDVMSPEEAGDYRRRLESLEARYADDLPVDRYIRYDPHYVLPLADELMRHPGMLAIAEALRKRSISTHRLQISHFRTRPMPFCIAADWHPPLD